MYEVTIENKNMNKLAMKAKIINELTMENKKMDKLCTRKHK